MINRYVLCIIFSTALAACSSNSTGSGGGGNGGGNGTPVNYSLSVSVSPSGAGTTDPVNDSFEEGTDVTVEAFPNDGWEFGDWTGDVQSQDNPLTFTINQNTSLTANFNSISSIYEVEITVTDSLDSQNLKFGQKNGATDGYDSGMDTESPGAPPASPPALYTYFKNDSGDRFLWDFRSFTDTTITWNWQLAQVRGDSLDISWARGTTRLTGSITLRTADSSLVVNMVNQASVRIAAADADSLLIDYELNLNP